MKKLLLILIIPLLSFGQSPYTNWDEVFVNKIYYESGELKSIQDEITHYENSSTIKRPHGPFKSYYKNGKVKMEGNKVFKIGKKGFMYCNPSLFIGEIKYFHENGNLKFIKNYEVFCPEYAATPYNPACCSNFRTNDWKKFNEDGELITESKVYGDNYIVIFYVDGMIDWKECYNSDNRRISCE